jgi:hypothetical protein
MTRKHKHGELTQAQASQHKQANTSTTSKQANSHKHDKQANTSIVSKQASKNKHGEQAKKNKHGEQTQDGKQAWQTKASRHCEQIHSRQDNQANKAWQANTFRQTNISMARKNDHGELSQAWQPKTSDTASKYIHASQDTKQTRPTKHGKQKNAKKHNHKR